ncbi:MAG: hypothetical protein LBV08_05175, partial [Clostridiales bacterium]|nr:hypothetical protein [Clostridiales bacterium]
MRIIIIIALIVFTGCSSSVRATAQNLYTEEIKKATENNMYIDAYNSITQNMSALISDYKKTCGLSDTLEYKGVAFSAALEPQFFNTIEKPLPLPKLEKYQPLYDSVAPLVLAYNNSVEYYNRETDKNITELNFLHNEFLINYVNFKNAYLGFSNEILENYNGGYIDEIDALNTAGLGMHIEFCNLVDSAINLCSSLQDPSRHDEALHTIRTFKSQLKKVISYNEGSYREYGLNGMQILNLQNIIIISLDIER